MQSLWANGWNLVRPHSRETPERIAALVPPPALAVLACGCLVRRFPLLPALAFVVSVVVTVIAMVVVVVLVALRRE